MPVDVSQTAFTSAAARVTGDGEKGHEPPPDHCFSSTFFNNAATSAHNFLHASRSSAGRLATASRSGMPARSGSFSQCWSVWRIRDPQTIPLFH
jgi:hypothetical protein